MESCHECCRETPAALTQPQLPPASHSGKVEADLGISYGRANKLVGQLVELGILDVVDLNAYKRRFFAPRVLEVLTGQAGS